MANENSRKYQKIYETQRAVIERKFAQMLKGKEPKSLYKPCDFIIRSGGKRLRSFLVLLSTKAVGGKYSDAYNAALSVELLHNFTLVHDDIMDNADKRRGLPTLHIKYDLSTAILTGDTLFGLAYHYLLLDCKNNDKEVLSNFTESIIEVCEGQSMDEEFELRKKISIDEYKTMISKKTAALAEMCCAIGAQIGGGKRSEINALKKYGKNLGMAFQIQDDLLDVIGEEDKFGKKVGGDLIEGKKTFIFLKALEKAKGEDKKRLKKVIENKGIRKNQVRKYQELYEKLGVFKDTGKEVEKYSRNALNAIKNVKDDEARETLIWLTHALIKRNT
ncbi:MAG: polyprenyl synthetase family protein [Melioribacteraceae bacterium]|nr:polyprenyl synthetase family protein [Melioribacteraceae bacterium]MCF8352958.1 polyprenyl synthetase family protein [Melioribacteraceae bacterium]MCF8395835.1 polyprenyl synthetase family protein [Melioribacteraceae bacterium]MCF8417475.1 polyprenyl synthetase family protein [Melioribacteraceae bacterium]